MFKYGSFRSFIAKFFAGILLLGFGLIYFASLYTYDPVDPGFSQLNLDIKENEIRNVFGYFGAYL